MDGLKRSRGSYLDRAPDIWVHDRDGIRLTFHSEHRPLEAYSRALEAAGLLTETIREVRAPDHVVATLITDLTVGDRTTVTIDDSQVPTRQRQTDADRSVVHQE